MGRKADSIPRGMTRTDEMTSRPTPTFLKDEAGGEDRNNTIPWATDSKAIKPDRKTEAEAVYEDMPVLAETSPNPLPATTQPQCTHVHVSLVGVGDLGVNHRRPAAHHHHHLTPPILTACRSPTLPSPVCCPPLPQHQVRGCPTASPPPHLHQHREDHGLWGARCGVGDQPAMCGAGVLHFVDDVVTYTTRGEDEEDLETHHGSPHCHH